MCLQATDIQSPHFELNLCMGSYRLQKHLAVVRKRSWFGLNNPLSSPERWLQNVWPKYNPFCSVGNSSKQRSQVGLEQCSTTWQLSWKLSSHCSNEKISSSIEMMGMKCRHSKHFAEPYSTNNSLVMQYLWVAKCSALVIDNTKRAREAAHDFPDDPVANKGNSAEP